MSAKDYFKEFTDFTDKELQEADQEVNILTLFTGRSALGDDFWAYLLVPPSKYIPLYETDDFSTTPLDSFGEVLDWGLGTEPPEGVKTVMELKYQANHNLEAEVLERAKEIEHRMRIGDRLARKILGKDDETEGQA